MKRLMVICAPVTSRSGYGAHARDLVHSFNDLGEFDIKIVDVKWGECPRNALNENNEKDKKLIDMILKTNSVDKQPDVYVDIRIPNEFQTIGKFNIGITAGTETTAVSQKWLEACNKMDLVIVPSEHSKSGFVKSIYDKMQQAPNGQQQKIGELKLEKPMEVLFEGVDDTIYKPLNSDEISTEFFDFINKKIPETYAFLSVGQWTAGNFGEDRKNIGRMIKIFYESFANKTKQPALILKTSGATYSILDKEECLKKIKQIKDLFPSDWKLPNVYLLHGDLTDEEINYLYNHPKIKSLVSFTHGEGFGRPMLEATFANLPVVATNWSGHIDFLDTENSVLLGGSLENIPNSVVWQDILIPESQWFNVNEEQGYKSLNYVFKENFDVKRKAEKLGKYNRENYTQKKMTEKLKELLDVYLKNLPTQVGLTLPKLKKVDDKKSTDTPEIKLPKLQKV